MPCIGLKLCLHLCLCASIVPIVVPPQLLPTHKRHKPNSSSPLPADQFQVSCVDQRLVQLLDPGRNSVLHTADDSGWPSSSYIGKGNHHAICLAGSGGTSSLEILFPSKFCMHSIQNFQTQKNLSLYVSVLHGQRWLFRDPRCQELHKLHFLKSKNSSHFKENGNHRKSLLPKNLRSWGFWCGSKFGSVHL